jgi:hypothetical protein
MMVEAMATIMAKYNWRMPHLDEGKLHFRVVRTKATNDAD